MAMTALGELAKFPSANRAPTSDFNLSYYTLDLAGEKATIIFPLAKAGTISKLGFRVSTVTTPETLRVSLQTVGADGFPTGTLFGGSTAGTQEAPAAATAYTVALGTGATVAAGDVGTLVAMVVEFDSLVGNVRISAISRVESLRLPYSMPFTGSWSRDSSANMVAWVEYSDGSYADSFLPSFSNTSTHTYGSTTAGADEYGCAIRSPLSLRVIGFWATMGLNAGADYEAILYLGTAAQRTRLLDGDANAATNTFSQTVNYGLFGTPFTMAADTEYIISIRPTTAATLAVRYVDFLSAAMMNAWGNANFYQKSRLDQGAWGDSLLRRPMIGVLFDAVDIPAGGGGGETFTGGQFNRGLN